jgi:hypothetical protein
MCTMDLQDCPPIFHFGRNSCTMDLQDCQTEKDDSAGHPCAHDMMIEHIISCLIMEVKPSFGGSAQPKVHSVITRRRIRPPIKTWWLSSECLVIYQTQQIRVSSQVA